MHQLKHDLALDELYHALLGLETVNIQFSNRLHVSNIERSLVEPFAFLITKVRSFMNICEFEPFIAKFFKKLLYLKESGIPVEQLFVALQEDMTIFKELEEIKNSRIIEEYANNSLNLNNEENSANMNTVYDMIYDKRKVFYRFFTSKTSHSEIKEYFMIKYLDSISKDVMNWINKGIPGHIIRIDQIDGFYSSYWDTTFKLDIAFFKDDKIAEDVLECGKLVHLIRTAYEMEISGDKCVELTPDGIKTHKMNLLKKVHQIIRPDLEKEKQILYDIILFRRVEFYDELFDEFQQKLLDLDDSVVEEVSNYTKIRNSSTIKVSSTEDSFTSYLLRLLKNKANSNQKKAACILERICFSVCSNLLKYFFSSKTFTELKILNRFLVTVHGLSHLMDTLLESNRNSPDKTQITICRAIQLILFKLKEIEISPVPSDDIGDFYSKFNNQIRGLLNSYNLTNSEVFENWANLFEYAYEMRHGNSSKRRLVEILSNLQQSITIYGENDMSDILYRILSSL